MQQYSQQYPNNYPTSSNNHPNNSTQYSDPHHEDILSQLERLDRQNKKLVSIADNIMKTSFLRNFDQTPAVILQLEQDMKLSFNALIESIRQFFMSIDTKVKELGQIIQARMDEVDTERSQYPIKKTQSDKMDNLVMRIAFMEQNIKRSQQNEARLISIIEEMNNKKLQDQPTIRKQHQRNNNPFNACKMINHSGTQEQEQNSFRLFSMGTTTDKKNKERKQETPAAYQRFQQYSNSPIVQSIEPKHFRGKEMPPYYCGPRKEEHTNNPKNMNYLKGSTSQFQYQSSNKIHRLSNLLKGLKE